MNTTLNQNRSFNLFIVAGFAITLVVMLAFAVAPSITAFGPAIIPVTGSQNAYIEFLRGEKAVYASPLGLSEALSAYHVGEQAVYASVVDSGNALLAFHLGEKIIVRPAGSAMWNYRQGEKAIVRFDALESALLAYHQGEKDAK